MKTFGMIVVKNLLMVINTIYMLLGLALISFGVAILLITKTFSKILDNDITIAAGVCILFGSAVFLISILAFYGASNESFCLLFTAAALMFMMFFLQIASAIAGYLYKDEFMKRVNDTMILEKDANKDAWDAINQALGCCGLYGPKGWPEKQKVPKSCCFFNGTLENITCPNITFIYWNESTANRTTPRPITLPPTNDTNDTQICTGREKDLYQDGCLDIFKRYFEWNLKIAMGIGIALLILEAINIYLCGRLCVAIRWDWWGWYPADPSCCNPCAPPCREDLCRDPCT